MCQLKFVTQYVVVPQPPPPMAIQVTCTITTMQIIPLGGQGALEIIKQPTYTWEEHLYKLPMESTGHLNISYSTTMANP